jgi:hypothetical protein
LMLNQIAPLIWETILYWSRNIDPLELGFDDDVKEGPGLKPKSLQRYRRAKDLRVIQKTP